MVSSLRRIFDAKSLMRFLEYRVKVWKQKYIEFFRTAFCYAYKSTDISE